MRDIKAAIFDMDGTLIDSMGAWHRVDEKFLTRRGLPVERDYADAVKGLPFDLCARYTIERYDLSETPEQVVAEWRECIQQEYDFEIPAKDGVMEYLEHLRSRGVKIAIATSSEPELCLGAIRRLGIDEYVDSITYTQEVARPKDFPDVYLLAAERLGVSPSETAVYEDALKGLRAAKEGGFIAVAVYDEASDHDWADMAAIADYAVRDLRELM